MRAIVYSSKIKKDLKLYQKRGLSLAPFYEVVLKIAKGELLAPINQDHPLHGKLAGKRACHIKPDWVLIYALKKNEVMLYRTGTHADLYE
ncbi:MAG: type II toxin-antitoxin system YafQ family toxin [Anaerolineales bacterium]|nr:type II toxin-antitoxin system YafQ family toxin [Anaerolineales bacterium]